MRNSPYIALIGLFLAIGARGAGADTVKQVNWEIKQGSVLTLRNDVAQDLAQDLLARATS
jgi:hypothetical protein